MAIPIFQVNAFTHKVFSGNPAGVCILDEFFAYQASARAGYMRLILNGDRVLLVGKAVTFFSGEVLS